MKQLKHRYIAFLAFCLLFGGQARAQLTRIIYAPSATEKVLGISNSLLFNGKITLTVGSVPLAPPTGYPDPGFWAGKGYLLNEDGLVANGQFQNGHYDHDMDIKLTPNNKLALVYQYPTGNLYGFLMPYKIWNGTAIESSEFIYPQDANIGSRLRLQYGTDGLPRAISFANAGYALVYHEKPLGFWETSQLTNFGTAFTIGNAVMDGNVFYALTKIENNTTQIVLFKIDGNNLTGESLATTSTQVHDLQLKDGTLYALYSQNNDLILSKRLLTATTWTYETVLSEAEHHRAGLSFDNASTPYITYRAGNLTTGIAFKVIKKVGNAWINVLTREGLTYDAEHMGWGRHAQVIQKGTEAFTVYSDNRKVYYTNLSALPTGLSASGTTATSTNLAWSSTNWATFYKIFRDGVEVGTSNTLAYTDPNLLPSTNYCYTFQACNENGCTTLSTPPVCIKTLTPFELTSLNIANTPVGAGNFTLVRDCEKDIAMKIKNTTNLPLTYGFKVTRETGGLNVLFEQASITFAPNEEKTIDKNWAGDGTQNSNGGLFGNNPTVSEVGNYVWGIYACPTTTCPTVFNIATTTDNLIRTASGINNPQNYAVVAPAIEFGTAPANVVGEATTAPYPLSVNTNMSWSATANQPWVTIQSSPTGVGNTSLQYAVAENTTGASRTANITLTGCGGFSKSYLITQKKKVPASNIILPTVFTPNEDGKNDVFLVRGTGIMSIELKILNSKGSVVWQTNNLQEALETGWKAEKMPNGIYLCNLRATFEAGDTKELNQAVQLLR